MHKIFYRRLGYLPIPKITSYWKRLIAISTRKSLKALKNQYRTRQTKHIFKLTKA